MSFLRAAMEKAHRIETEGELEDYFKPKHYAWLTNPDKRFSKHALEHAQRVLAGETQRERSQRFSPSSIGTPCERELLFSFGGAPKLPSQPSSEDKMESGTFEHIRWQMEGLSAGWLDLVEVWVHSPEMQCGGSADGRGDDGSLFEFKNTAAHLYQGIKFKSGSAKHYAADMTHKHRLQMEAYWLVDEVQAATQGVEPYFRKVGSLVYQDRDSKDVFEIRVKHDPGLRREVEEILNSAVGWVDLNQLPAMLEGCHKVITPGQFPSPKEQKVFDRCAYREHCPTARTVFPGLPAARRRGAGR